MKFGYTHRSNRREANPENDKQFRDGCKKTALDIRALGELDEAHVIYIG